jgi:hypothetical protein
MEIVLLIRIECRVKNAAWQLKKKPVAKPKENIGRLQKVKKTIVYKKGTEDYAKLKKPWMMQLLTPI